MSCHIEWNIVFPFLIDIIESKIYYQDLLKFERAFEIVWNLCRKRFFNAANNQQFESRNFNNWMFYSQVVLEFLDSRLKNREREREGKQ